MCGGIVIGSDSIDAGGKHLAVADDDGTEGSAAICDVLDRQVDCHLHIFLIFSAITCEYLVGIGRKFYYVLKVFVHGVYIIMCVNNRRRRGRSVGGRHIRG